MTTLNNSSKKRRRRGRRIASNDIYSTLILDEVLMGEVGFVSRDIWNELYGGITAEEDDGGKKTMNYQPRRIPQNIYRCCRYYFDLETNFVILFDLVIYSCI